MTINIREYVRHIYKYLGEGILILTRNGKPYLKVTIERCHDDCHDNDHELSRHDSIEDVIRV